MSLFPGNIFGNESYIDFSPQITSWPVVIAAIPIIYIFPTLFVLVRVVQVYVKSIISNERQSAINENIFFVLILAQIMSFLYFFADYAMIRLPATGYFTSWCAQVEPNHFLKFIFFFSFYFNYAAMIFPFLLCFFRLLLVLLPNNHMRLTRNLLKFLVPLIIVYPIFFTFFLIPSVGYCRQLGSPYPFGSVSIYYSGSLFGLRNSIYHLINTITWCLLCLLVNIILFIKVRKATNSQTTGQTRSSKSRKAEISLTITTISMIMPYVTYSIFTVLYLQVPAYTYYMMIIRPFGSDIEAVIVPWIFYLTHPVFQSTNGSSSSSLIVVSAFRPSFQKNSEK